MSIQLWETITYEKERYPLYGTPLESYFELIAARPETLSYGPVLDRGYLGEWEIIEGQLYLIDLIGSFTDRPERLSLEHVFPGACERVFAHWYSGSLILLKGKLLQRMLVGPSIHEQTLIIEIKNGIVNGERLINNPPPPPLDKTMIPYFLWPKEWRSEEG